MNINQIKHNLKTNVPVFKAGDTVRVKVKVVEGDNERLQAFDGVVVARKGSGIGETFTVRKISFGVGVERIFPIHSPRVDSIEVLKIGKVRRQLTFNFNVFSASRMFEADQSCVQALTV